MPSLDQKIDQFILQYFPDIDYSTLGSNKDRPEHQMGFKYEYFVNSIEFYSIQKTIDSESIKFLSTGDMRGIDGCFFVLNKQLFTIPDYEDGEIFNDWKKYFDEELEKCKKAEVNFCFIQSKSTKTELDKLKGFCDAVYDIFSSDPTDLSGKPKVKTINYVFNQVCKIENDISLTLKFCSIPKDSRQVESLLKLPEWISAIQKNKHELKSTKFNDVQIEIKSGQDYQDKLEAILSPNQRGYPIQKLNDRFIEIKSEYSQCYIGYLDLLEIKDILQNADGDLDDIFFDNIRYFEGLGEEGSVNKKIYKSLSTNPSVFHALHNGITITAHSKHFNQATETFEIKSFSIINGCQSCNLIWLWIKDRESKLKELEDNIENKESAVGKKELEVVKFKMDELKKELNSIKIPVKIIITSDPELRSKITEAANTQNEVESIQLIAISEEAKSLQNLFNTDVRSGERIFYERLSRQFPEIGKSFKISTEDVLRAFYSTFQKSPHKLTVGYGKFEKEKLKNKDFLATKSNGESKYDLQTYYIASLLMNYLERYLRSQSVSLISLKHHLLLLLCISIDKDFEEINPETKLKSSFIDEVKKIISDKTSFNQRVESICKIAIENFDFYIDNIDKEKPKVKAKSYYSEEGTLKMIEVFKLKYFVSVPV